MARAWVPALLAALVGSGCGFMGASIESRMEEQDIDPEALVELDEQTRVTVRPARGGVEMVYLDHDPLAGWQMGSGYATAARVQGTLLGMTGSGGEDGRNWDSLLFGLGPDGTASVRIVGRDGHAELIDPATGAFIVALREEVSPAEIRYQLLSADGSILFDGLGLGPAE